jgi:type I restriction enzyme R subunit
VDLLDVVSRPRGPAADIQLAYGEARELNSLGAAGSGTNRDPKLLVLEEIVNRLNEIFGQDLPKDVRENFVISQLNSLQQDDRLVAQAKNNTEAQFMVSPGLKNSVLSAAFRNQADQGQMLDHLFSGERVQLEVVKLLGRTLFQTVKKAQ